MVVARRRVGPRCRRAVRSGAGPWQPVRAGGRL